MKIPAFDRVIHEARQKARGEIVASKMVSQNKIVEIRRQDHKPFNPRRYCCVANRSWYTTAKTRATRHSDKDARGCAQYHAGRVLSAKK